MLDSSSPMDPSVRDPMYIGLTSFHHLSPNSMSHWNQQFFD